MSGTTYTCRRLTYRRENAPAPSSGLTGFGIAHRDHALDFAGHIEQSSKAIPDWSSGQSSQNVDLPGIFFQRFVTEVPLAKNSE